MTRRQALFTVLTLISTLALAACSAPAANVAAPTAAAVEAPPATPTLPAESTAATTPAASETQPATAAQPPATVPAAPIAVTYTTTSQQEGPYYTIDKPADRDNDLVDFAGATAPPAGQVLEFGGTVYDAGGRPQEGLVVEIWQADASGVYLHPGDPDTEQRDRNFQFYGEALTAADGRYSFRTILPGLYEPRPRHIHVKVKRDGQELLTTQFYFAGEIELQGEQASMLIDAQPGQDAAGNPILVGERDIVLNVTLSTS